MDFYQIGTREIERGPNKGQIEIFPDFTVGRSKDLMVRGRAFYAIWDEVRGLWSTDEYDVQRLVDEELYKYAQKARAETGGEYHVKYLRSFGSNGWSQFRKFIQNISDNSHQLDTQLTFINQETKKTDYVSKKLPYILSPGDYSAWDELVGTLYSVQERAKIEWAIGSVVAGDSSKIQKFLVFYGPPGSGKGTVINVLQRLFEGYYTTFDAKALGSSSAAFATAVFKDNPLVAIQHDGDLSKIEENARLNSIISHEEMTMNEKFKPEYMSKVHAMLFMGTNQPVKISDAKSGIIRRLIDVHPSGVKIPINHYLSLVAQAEFELGAIANHCLEVYRAMGKNYYNGYRPLEMMLQTDVFFNFIEANYDIFKHQDGVTLRQAYQLYKEYCADTGIERPIPQYKVREELRNYFDDFRDRVSINGELMRSYYSGFNANKFKAPTTDEATFSLVMDETISLLDEMLADMPAQYANSRGYPVKYWTDAARLIDGELKTPEPHQIVNTTLRDINTQELHFVKLPKNHIVIDFDLKDVNGVKSLERNLEAASVWPATYAELSKGGGGVHLHYIYDGDVTRLASHFLDGIEIKTLLGDASLRRRLSHCNNVPVATISSGLPLKEKKVLTDQTIKSEKGLRDLIARNMQKKIHPGTKPSIDFIHKILEEAYSSGMQYDVTDLRSPMLAFANGSSNNAMYCIKLVQKMKFQGQVEEPAKALDTMPRDEDRIVLFDVEVYPNLFVICWKYRGSKEVVRMLNPTAQDVEKLFKLKLVGFANRRYDNHILYARYLGYDNAALYQLSQKIINNVPNSTFGEAYNLSYADIYDFSSKKQSLKKFEIELGIHHMEMDLPWDEDVPEEMIPKVVEYCVNDVNATEATLEARWQDFVARQILADLSGLTVNDTTQKHTAKIIFEGDRNARDHFKYTDLSEEFPGYIYDHGKSQYKGENPGEGGYVYAEPGMYEDVVLLDIASMHPTTIIELDMFGKYTKNFAALRDARLAIKRSDYDSARKMLGGMLEPYLKDPEDATNLSEALKIVINIVYGLTSAKFDNPFRDPRNKDNIVAKRGALFMIYLKELCQDRGMKVVHIKTDSIKIVGANEADINFVTEIGADFGYTFEHEATYDKMCLVNDAVYIAHVGWAQKEKKIGTWEAVGAQFQHPYVFKTLFTGDYVEFDDMCETKQVAKGAMYLDFDSLTKPAFEDSGKMHFVGRTGRFLPVSQESGLGGFLWRIYEGRLFAVTGTKGYLWVEAEMAKEMGAESEIDMNYFEHLIHSAKSTINKFGDFDTFVETGE